VSRERTGELMYFAALATLIVLLVTAIRDAR